MLFFFFFVLFFFLFFCCCFFFLFFFFVFFFSFDWYHGDWSDGSEFDPDWLIGRTLALLRMS